MPNPSKKCSGALWRPAFAIAAIASLAACSALEPIDVISTHAPVISATSTRTVPAVTGCLQDHFLSDASYFRIIARENDTDLLAGTLQMGSFKYAWKISVSRSVRGSSIEARRSESTFAPITEQDVREAIRKCASA